MSLFHSGSKAIAFAHEHPSFFYLTISISHSISNVNFKNYIYSSPKSKHQNLKSISLNSLSPHLISLLLFSLFQIHMNEIYPAFLQLHFVFLAYFLRRPNLNSIINLSLSLNTFFIFLHNSFTFNFKSISSSIFISSFSITSNNVISLSSLSLPIGSFKYTS